MDPVDDVSSVLFKAGAGVWMKCGWIKVRVRMDVDGGKLPAPIPVYPGGDPKVVHIVLTAWDCDW